MYWWADIDAKQSIVVKQVGAAAEGIVDWYNYNCMFATFVPCGLLTI